jgi:N-acetylmuramoyl-L-alanine amidase
VTSGIATISRRRVIGLAAASALAPGLIGAEEASRVDAVDVALDPGHSRIDVGAFGAGVGEYVATLDVGIRVAELLETAGLRVRLTRRDHEPLSAMNHPNATERVRIEQDARIAASVGARIFVSLHFNGAGDQRIAGTETYYNADNHGHASLALARALQAHVHSAIRDTGYAPADRGVKEDLLAGKPYGHFFSLRGPRPSVLVEALFLSNPREAALVASEEIRAAIARGYAAGIHAYLTETG